MSEPMSVPGLPFPAVPSGQSPWTVEGDGLITVTAMPHSDLFIDPTGESGTAAETLLNAVTLLGEPPAGDFVFTARVATTFESTFDAGVLLLWADERHWAKLCFERSPSGAPMVVSVVTRGVADDANAFSVAGQEVWLRIARVGRAFAFHASPDGADWAFVRVFALGDGLPPVRVGFEAQSPTGEGCRVGFDHISFASRTLADLRDGS
ncbi:MULTISPECIES: DUF1349 domain-containing protein [unclassified Pseudarthrobacter]|uniref:DUF1349 domain-containing protein n=1 Tax=unclassified Pseudarthrobacter TaxID=2647000 RepID=UPI003632230A